MLAALQRHEGPDFERVAQRVRYAGELEGLWYLRQDMMAALSAAYGEEQARENLREVNALFKGVLPDAMVAKPNPRFAS